MWEDLREEKGASGQGIACRVLLTEKVVLKLFLVRQHCAVARRIDLESAACLKSGETSVSSPGRWVELCSSLRVTVKNRS